MLECCIIVCILIFIIFYNKIYYDKSQYFYKALHRQTPPFFLLEKKENLLYTIKNEKSVET